MNRRVTIAAGVAASTIVVPMLGAVAAPTATKAPVTSSHGEVIDGQYVVFLAAPKGASAQDSRAATQAAVADVKNQGVDVMWEYDHLSGFTAKLDAQQLETLRQDERVASIAEDVRVKASDVQAFPTPAAQTNQWGLDRIDSPSLDSDYSPPNKGAGVHAYIVDTGVNSHPEFSGRLGAGRDFIDNDNDGSDCQGHGTHVAGTVGGSSVGVAPEVTLHSVRVLDCRGFGTYSSIVGGMDWVAGNAEFPAVVNMSLGGPASSGEDEAVARLSRAGVTTVVAAGNESRDACNTSPARAPEAITVASSTRSDARSSFSNFGRCVDVFAPGSDIRSSSMNGGYVSLSGTSMASPHVAGVAALYLSANRSAQPAAVQSAIVGGSLDGVISGASGSPNKLVNVDFIGGSATPTPTPTMTPTNTPTSTPTMTPTTTPTSTPTSTADPTVTVTVTTTPTATDSPTGTPTGTPTVTVTDFPTPTITPTGTPTGNPTIIPTPTDPGTPTSTSTPTATSTPTIIDPTVKPTPTLTATPSPSPSITDVPVNEFENNTSMLILDDHAARTSVTSNIKGAKNITVTLAVEHACSPDLEVALISPSGYRNILKWSWPTYVGKCYEWTGKRAATFPLAVRSDGEWTLEIVDRHKNAEGTLNGWSARFT